MTTNRLFPLPIIVLAVLLCAPASGFAQTTFDQSILQTSGNFAILGETAITNAGATDIMTGNVGVSPGTAISGFQSSDGGPGMVTGGGTTIVGGASAQAVLDLGKAATGLSSMPSNVTMSGVDLGGTTLLPGVYTFSGAATLTGALQLNANFQNNVFWVFQIGTALTASSTSSVTLINPGSNLGSDDGIFWDAETGAITIGAGSTALGNYLAGTSITFGGTTSGVGGARALAQAAVSLDTNIVNSYGGPGGSDWTGGLMFNQSGAVVPFVAVPEPAAILWLTPLGAIGFTFWRRRSVTVNPVSSR